MFKNLKQKIATGQEGVSPGRQTPLRGSVPEKSPKSTRTKPAEKKVVKESSKNDSQSGTPVSTDRMARRNSPQEVLARVQHLLEVGKAQAENNGILDQLEGDEKAIADPLGVANTPGVSPDVRHKERSTGSQQKELKTTTPGSLPSTPKSQKSLDFSISSTQSTPAHERSDHEMDLDTSTAINSLSPDELLHLYRKQEKILSRYKTRFTEVVDAYKGLQKEKEKLENTLTSGQDKQLRRVKELKETIDLEQQAKRHMEEAMRLSLEEKDEMIKVLETKVTFLKEGSGSLQNKELQGSTPGATESSSEKVADLQSKLDEQSKEIDKFKGQLRSAHEVIIRLEQEKKTALQEIMENMQRLVAEKNELKAEVIMQKDENKKKDGAIEMLQKGQEGMRKEIEKQLREEILEQAILRQEKEMQAIYQKKEDEMKLTFAGKVKEFQRLIQQKQDTLKSKDDEIEKFRSKVSELENEIKAGEDKDSTAKSKIQALIKERGDWEKKYYDANAKTSEEQAKVSELVQQHTRQLKLKQDEQQQQINKVKRASANKLNELQEVIKQNEAKIAEMETGFTKDMESKQKEQESQKHVEISKATRKYESKINDMKKMIKELRNDIAEKETKMQSQEDMIADMQSKQADSEGIVAGFENRIEELTKELEAKNFEIETKEKRLQDVIDDSEAQIQDARKNYEANSDKQNEEVSKLKEGLASWERELKEIEAKYRASEEELSELKSLNSNYKSHNEKLESALRESEKKVDDVKSQYDGLQAQEKQNLEEKISELRTEIEDLQTEKLKVEEDAKKALEEVEMQKATNAELEKSLDDGQSSKREEIEKLRSEFEEREKSVTIRIGDLESKLREAEDGFAEMSRQMEGKKSEIASLEELLKSAQEGMSASESKMQDDLHAKEIKIGELAREMEKEREAGSRERSKLELEICSNKDNVGKLSKEVEEKVLELNSLKAELQVKIEAFEKERDDFKAKIVDITESLKKSENVSKKLNKQKKVAEDLAKKLENEIQMLSDNSMANEKGIELKLKELEDTKNHEISELQSQLEQAQNELVVVESMHQETKLKMTKAEKDLQVELDRKISEEKQKSVREVSNLAQEIRLKDEEHAKALEKSLSESKKKYEELGNKYRKILADKEQEHKTWIQNVARSNEEKMTECKMEYDTRISDMEDSFKNRLEELETCLTDLRRDKAQVSQKLENSEKQFNEGRHHWKDKEGVFRNEVEEMKNKLHRTNEDYKIKVVELEKELMNWKSTAEELKMRVLSGENNNKEIDVKFHEMVEEKRDLESKLIAKEQEISEKLESAEQSFDGQKKLLEEQISRLEDELVTKGKEYERTLDLRLSDQSKELGDQNKTKLLDMKKKAESKIANLKRQHTATLEQKDNKISELISAIEELRANIDNETTANERKAADTETGFQVRLEELEGLKEKEVESLKEELGKKNNDLEELREKLADLEEKLERKTVEKMDALRRQKEDFLEENDKRVESLQKGFDKKVEDLKRKYEAQVEDKEYEYTSRVKGVIKEFQAKLSDKDREHEEGLDESLDRMQKEEQRIVCHYEDQILELKRELKLRDDDMRNLKEETEKKLNNAENVMQDQLKKHEDEFLSLEKNYDSRIHEMAKKYEEDLENVKAQGKVVTEQHQGSVDDIEQRHLEKIAELEESHRKEKANIEKKLKIQMKKNQSEMKKLLAEKGALPAGRTTRENEDWELHNHLNNGNNEIEADQGAVSDMKAKIGMLNAELTAYKERERNLKQRLEGTPRNGRPDTLNISGSLNTSVCSSPSTPEPIEYEYLKNILFQYMMGRQRKQMAKVLAAIVHFSPSQTRQIVDNEEQLESTVVKSASWF